MNKKIFIIALYLYIQKCIISLKRSELIMVGEKIQKIRKQKGLTQAQLADSINKNPNLLSRWERGEVKINAENLEKIAQALDVPISELYEKEDGQKNTPEPELGLAYWGEVADNLHKLINSKNEKKISIVKSMLNDSLNIKDAGISIQ